MTRIGSQRSAHWQQDEAAPEEGVDGLPAPPPRVITAGELSKNTKGVLDGLARDGGSALVFRNGKPLAVLRALPENFEQRLADVIGDL